MHYDNTSFSKNGLPTILPKQQGVEIGQRRMFSPIDVFKINTMYGCPVPQNVPGPVDQASDPRSCNFDNNWCGWIQDYRVVLDPNQNDPYPQYADEYDFYRISGQTPSANTGPNGDHTSGNGRYIYTEASFPADRGDRFRVRTPMITGNGATCVSFWYSMYADTAAQMGALTVSTQASGEAAPTVRWSRVGAQMSTPTWAQATFPINVSGSFQVIFEYTRGSDYQGDAALDDFLVYDGLC